MTSIPASTPVLIGVGQFTERIGDPGYESRSPVALAAEAAKAAIADARAALPVAPMLDAIAAIRQFEISSASATAPFGRSNNFPRSVARRLGAQPARAILAAPGGQGPQKLLGEMCGSIARGETQLALLVGAEAISTVRRVLAQGARLDWSENVEGDLDDRGYDSSFAGPALIAHGLAPAVRRYALLENARRACLRRSREDYRMEMAALFAPFAAVAAKNPFAASRELRSAADIATVSPRNRIVADPYTRLMVSRDQVCQGAAVLVASAQTARALGVPRDRWVFLHGHADATEADILERADLGAAPNAVAAAQMALDLAKIDIGAIAYIDLYSCFPIAVLNMIDGLRLARDDPRGFTRTGGLPYFGGPGNNYSMHAIAEIVRAVRACPGTYGFVGANGGALSKYAVGVYSTAFANWSDPSARCGRAGVKAAPVAFAPQPEGGVVETYTQFASEEASRVAIVGRTGAGVRFLAMSEAPDALAEVAAGDPIGRSVRVKRADGAVNEFAFA